MSAYIKPPDSSDATCVAPGGKTSQVLTKASDRNFDTEWTDVTASG